MAKPKQPEASRPLEQTLDEVFRYESKKRSTLGGIASAAIGGDREDLKRFAGAAVAFVERAAAREPNEDIADLADWLAFALSRIQGGAEPNDAFGWSMSGKGRPSARKNMSELRKRWMIGQHIAGLLAGDPSLSEAEAHRRVAEHHHVSAETARGYWEQWQGKRPVK